MAQDCSNCESPASERYSLVFESGELLEDRVLCGRCRTFFAEMAAVEVVQAPVLMRGGDEDPESE